MFHRDFTISCYRQLILDLQQAGYTFMTMEQYMDARQGRATMPVTKWVVLRHDVDLRPCNSQCIAEVEHQLGICATYYFRCLPCSFDEQIISHIAQLGHEIGYHYEDMSLTNGDTEKAILHFQHELERLRRLYPVRTICMHGAPTSRYDGRDLWKYYDYHSMGIVGEPYFDVDYSQCLYLTDTGRCWDGYNVSVRDKIPVYQDQWTARSMTYHSTYQLMTALHYGTIDDHLMITTHPQRWNDDKIIWIKELCIQSLKNIIKRAIVYGKRYIH